jgi:hypothetical protein
MPVENRYPQAFSFQFLEGARMPHYLLDAANNATELPFTDLDSVQSILNTMPTLAPEAPVLACEILDAWAEDCRILRRRPKLVLLNVEEPEF